MKLAIVLIASALGLSGCVGTIVDATTDAAIAVVKIPFKIGGAAVDMMKGKDPDEVGTSRSRRERDQDQDKEPAPDRDDDEGEDDKADSKAQTKT